MSMNQADCAAFEKWLYENEKRDTSAISAWNAALAHARSGEAVAWVSKARYGSNLSFTKPGNSEDEDGNVFEPTPLFTHSQVAEQPNNNFRSMLEGMSVSVDVSTGDDDSCNRYFGTVTEVMDCEGEKHGVTLLVQNAEPNFTTTKQCNHEYHYFGDQKTRRCNNCLELENHTAQPREMVSVPEGWKLAPIKPTDEMDSAGYATLPSKYRHIGFDVFRKYYKAMLAEAPSPAVDQPREVVSVPDGLRKLFVELTNSPQVCESGAVVGHAITNEQLDRFEAMLSAAPSPAVAQGESLSNCTQGNWQVVDGRHNGWNRIFINSPSGVICRISNEVSGRPLTEEDAANAYILAASKELLEALKVAQRELDACQSVLFQLEREGVDPAYSLGAREALKVIGSAINKAEDKKS